MKKLKKTLCVFLCVLIVASIFPSGFASALNMGAGNAATDSADLHPGTQNPFSFKTIINHIMYFIRYLIRLFKAVFGYDRDCTVTFVTNGGGEIPRVKVPKGGTLAEAPVPVKQDYAFVGWFLDEALTLSFYQDSPIDKDITLYAAYTERDAGLREFGPTSKYMEDCDPGVTFNILSPVALTAGNLADYVEITDMSINMPQVNVTGGGGVYTLSPATPYPAGGYYMFALKDPVLRFDGEDAEIRSLSFRIFKEEVMTVTPQDGIIYVLWQDVTTLSEGTFSVSSALYSVNTGDTVCFWDGAINGSTQFCKILLASHITGENPGEGTTVLCTEESAIQDVLKEVDVYFKQDVSADEYINNIDTEKIAQNVKNSEGARQITEILAKALSLSPAVAAAVNGTAGYSSGFEPVTENNDKVTVSIEDLVPGLTVTASIGSAINPNFPNAGKDDWAVFTLNFNYSAVIKMVEIKATFTVKEFVKSTVQGYKETRGADLYFDYAINSYSQTQITLAVSIKSKDASDDDYLNITEEIENLLNDNENDDADPAAILREVLGSKGDYIDLVDENLFTLSLPIIPVFTIFDANFELNFVVKVNFAAGISTGITLMAARQIGVCGSMFNGIQSYNNELPGNNRYSFDLYACGYLGFKAGLKLGISVSFHGLKSLGEIGISGEVGGYIDLYGFLHLNISKLTQQGAAKTSLQGGLYMEVGIYVEINLFAKSESFKVKAEYTVFEHKWPLFSLGDQYVMLRFKANPSTFIMNKDTVELAGSAGLLDAVYLDMTTGEEVTGNYSDVKNFYIEFSSPYLSFSRLGSPAISVRKDRFGSYAYTPRVSAGTKRIDAIAKIYYLGNNLAFLNNSEGYAYKTVPMIWLDASLNPALVLNTCKATYVFDIDGIKTTVAEKNVLYGEIPGGMDLYEYWYDYKITGYTNDFNAAITADTVYTVTMQAYQMLVSFISYYSGSWHFDVYAVKIGSMPQIPAGYASNQPFKAFTGWVGKSGYNSRMPTVYEVGNADYDISKKGWNLVCLGLDTTSPLHSSSGTYEQCIVDYYSSRLNPGDLVYAESGLYLYTAQYENQPIDVAFVFPAMAYTAFGQSYNNAGYTKTVQVKYSETIGAPSFSGYMGCNMRGWDVNGDGVPDYTYNELPAAAPGMSFTAVFELRKYAITELDINGNAVDTSTVNIGNLSPPILSTTPVYSDGSGATYAFKYWMVSKSGGPFVRWSVYSNPGVYEDWAVMPCYDKLYTVTFDYNGGKVGSNTQRIFQLKEGSYNIRDIIYPNPAKEDTLYDDFSFASWSCGETLTVTGNMTVTAQYTQTPIQYTAEFSTDTGVFADGSSSAAFTGGYDAWQAYMRDFFIVNATLSTVYTNTNIYTFSAWFSWAGEHSMRYEAQWREADRYYTVAFDAGEGVFGGGATHVDYPSMTYGAVLDFSVGTISSAMKPADVYNTFKLTGWRDHNGVVHALTDTVIITGDSTFTAVYEVDTRVLYTVSFNAGTGKFADNTQYKEFSGYYGDPVNIVLEDPAWVTNYANLYYVFAGWSQTTPTMFTQNTAITAQYNAVYYEFIVTFDAGTGVFSSTGTNVLTQTYHYNDPIVMNETPAKAASEFFTYTFNGWNLPFEPVTFDRTYTATYKAEKIGGTLPPAGILVTDGVVTEDINTGSIPGYTYEMVETWDGENSYPLLTVTDNGLSFSGSSSEVYIVVEDGVENVAFHNLSLSGLFGFSDAPLVFPSGVSGIETTVTVSGNCSIHNTDSYSGAIRCERKPLFEGADSTAALSLSSIDTQTIYCENGIAFSSLTLNITAAASGEDAWVAAFFSDGGQDYVVNFTDSVVNIESAGVGFAVVSIEMTGCVCDITCAGPLAMVGSDFNLTDTAFTAEAAGLSVGGNMNIRGNTTVDFSSTDSALPAVEIVGSLLFEDFTGTFDVAYQDAAATAPAVKVLAGIIFTVDGNPALENYNLGGAQIALLMDEADVEYYTFAVLDGSVLVPDNSVSVSPSIKRIYFFVNPLMRLQTQGKGSCDIFSTARTMSQ